MATEFQVPCLLARQGQSNKKKCYPNYANLCSLREKNSKHTHVFGQIVFHGQAYQQGWLENDCLSQAYCFFLKNIIKILLSG
jgi:hypothetical protein